MKTSKVYRLEYKDEGIYGSGWWFNNIRCNETERHPVPEIDMRLSEFRLRNSINLSDYHFGFHSLSSLKRWVYKKSWRKIMNTEGVELKVYEIPSKYKIIGTSQVLFDKSKAKLIKVIKVPE